MVDSSCSEEELSEAGRSLEEVLGSPTLMVTPLLVLCSKQDQEDARAVDKVTCCHVNTAISTDVCNIG